jgi:hypothetical protein
MFHFIHQAKNHQNKSLSIIIILSQESYQLYLRLSSFIEASKHALSLLLGTMQSKIFTHPPLPKAILPGALASATGSLKTKKVGA